MVAIHAVWIEQAMAATLGVVACAVMALWLWLAGERRRRAGAASLIVLPRLPGRIEFAETAAKTDRYLVRAWSARAPPGDDGPGLRRD